MDSYNTISLIDSEARRRARQSKALAGGRYHIEPFESVEEFSKEGNKDTLVLIKDENSSIHALLLDMKQYDYWSPVLAYGDSFDPIRCSLLMLRGIVGCLPDPLSRRDLEHFLDASADELAALVDLRYGAANARQKLKTLTKREAEVLKQLEGGLSNREIGEKLSISPRTVEVHRSKMLRKMDANSAISVIRMSVHASLT